MTDYDAARAKMKRLVDKPAEDTTKLPRVSWIVHFYETITDFVKAQQEHDEARDIFNLLNDQLVTELPQFVDLRIRTSSTVILTIPGVKLIISLPGPVIRSNGPMSIEFRPRGIREIKWCPTIFRRQHPGGLCEWSTWWSGWGSIGRDEGFEYLRSLDELVFWWLWLRLYNARIIWFLMGKSALLLLPRLNCSRPMGTWLLVLCELLLYLVVDPAVHMRLSTGVAHCLLGLWYQPHSSGV